MKLKQEEKKFPPSHFLPSPSRQQRGKFTHLQCSSVASRAISAPHNPKSAMETTRAPHIANPAAHPTLSWNCGVVK